MNFYDRWVPPPILDLVMRQNQLEKYRREVVASLFQQRQGHSVAWERKKNYKWAVMDLRRYSDLYPGDAKGLAALGRVKRQL